MEITEQKYREMMAAIASVKDGDYAVLVKILEFTDYFDTWKTEIEKLKTEFEGVVSGDIQSKFDDLSSKITEFSDKFIKMENSEAGMGEEMKSHYQEMEKGMQEFKNSISSLKTEIEKVRSEIPEMPDSFDPTDILNRVNEIETKIPTLPDEITPYQVRDKLESIDNESEKLKREAIQDLRKELDELKKLIKQSGGSSFFGGGGFNVPAMNLHHADNELVGTGDDATTQFSLDNLPSPTNSLHMTVGGGPMFVTDDYTISDTTITFLKAPPMGAKIRATYRI